MAGSISDYLENKLLDHVLKVASFSQPTIYVGLSKADPLDNASGLDEPVGNGYARVAHSAWDVAASRATENTGVITFPEAEGDWGTVTHFAIFDALSGGNMLAHGELAASKSITAGVNASFADGAIDVSLSAGGMSDDLANKLLDHVFENDAYSVPTNIYAALTTVAIGDDDTGTSITEPSGNGYARKLHNAYDAAAAGASENTGAITFDQATGSWGTITHWCLVDALTLGNILFHAILDNSRMPGDGDTEQFADGALDVTLA